MYACKTLAYFVEQIYLRDDTRHISTSCIIQFWVAYFWARYFFKLSESTFCNYSGSRSSCFIWNGNNFIREKYKSSKRFKHTFNFGNVCNWRRVVPNISASGLDAVNSKRN